MHSHSSTLAKRIIAFLVAAGLILILCLSTSTILAQTDEYPAVKKGTINSSNTRDRWVFDGTKGRTFIIDLSRTSGNLDPKLRLLDRNGKELASNDDYAGTMNSHIQYGLPYSGKYTVVVERSGGKDAASSGGYKLKVDQIFGFIESVGIGTQLYVSSSGKGTVGAISYQDEDILVFDVFNESWSMYFDGSDVDLGKSNADIDAFAIISNSLDDWNDDILLLSLDHSYNHPDIGWVDDSDILLFEPTSLGVRTRGELTVILEGSDLGLTGDQEDIDAISFAEHDDSYWFVISTKGDFELDGGISGSGQDMLILDLIDTEPESEGRWKLYFDGSDVDLSRSTENIVGLTIDKKNNGSDINFMTTKGSYTVAGKNGDGKDIFSCSPSSLNDRTRCVYGNDKYWDGSTAGLSVGYVDALHVQRP